MAFEAIAHQIFSNRGRDLTALDVVRLRDALTHDGPVTFAEILTLTAIEGAGTSRHPDWKSFYLDAVVAHIVSDTAPEGYIDAVKADRLLALAAPAGRMVSPIIFEAVCASIAAARWVPERLVLAALDEVLCAVACGNGVLRVVREAGGASVAEPCVITGQDVERVRRILYAAAKPVAGGGLNAFSAREVMALLAIDAAARECQNTEWIELLVAVIVDAAMTASFMSGPSRELLLAPYRSQAIGQQRLTAYRPLSIEERAIDSLERQRVAIITGDHPACYTAAELSGTLASQPATPAMAALEPVLAGLRPVLHPALNSIVAGRSGGVGNGSTAGVRAA